MPLDPCKPLERRDYEAFTEDCNGNTARRVMDECAVAKLNEIKTAIENQSGQYTQYIAGETVSALKFVYVGPDNKIYLGDSASYVASSVIGMTITAGNANAIINVESFGPAFDLSFAFGYTNPIYLTSLGGYSTTTPTVGHRVKLGQGMADGGIFIDIDEIVIL